MAGHDQEHEAIVELLPDYAVGALDDAQEQEVIYHLDRCSSCRHELQQILQIVGILGSAPYPHPATREKLLARARGEWSPPSLPRWEPHASSQSSRTDAQPSDERRVRPRSWWVRTAPVAFVLAAALILLALGISLTRNNRGATNGDAIASIMADAPFFPLTDGELSPPASGVLFAVAQESRAVLIAQGLPPLPADQRYQVWLFSSEEERSSGGLFLSDASGRAEVLIETPRPMSAYAAVAVSAEPAAGSGAPTSPLALGGWLN